VSSVQCVCCSASSFALCKDAVAWNRGLWLLFVDSTKQRPSQLREAQPPEGRPILAKWLERKELGEWGDLKNEKKMKVEMHEVGKLGIGGP
jgi:hypothetical protein